MSIFKNLVSIWNSEDLLSQAWDESREMLEFSEDMFSSAVKYLRRGVKIKKSLISLEKRFLKNWSNQKMFDKSCGHAEFFYVHPLSTACTM